MATLRENKWSLLERKCNRRGKRLICTIIPEQKNKQMKKRQKGREYEENKEPGIEF